MFSAIRQRAFHSSPRLGTEIFSRSALSRTPLTQALPNLPALTPKEIDTAASDRATVSTLKSGVRVASLPSSSAVGSVGVFIEAGSRYEEPHLSGISHFMELMAFKSTNNRSDFRLVRDMLKIGANITASASREYFVLAGDALKQYIPHVLGALSDVVQQSSYAPHEIVAVKERYEGDLIENFNAPEVRMMEAIQEAAYFNNTLGYPLYAPAAQLHAFDNASLSSYAKLFFTPSRIVVAGLGMAHEDLCTLTEKLFVYLPEDVKMEKQKAVYTGGESRMHYRGMPATHVSIAFETANWSNPDLVPLCVLQMLMGGGGSFSAGGPGKGMYSRLYTNVLNKHEFVESASSFNSIYSDSSLFGLYGISDARSAGKLVDVLIREALRMAGPVDAVELKRAKNALKSAMLIQLEQRATRLDDIGKQVSALGRVWSTEEVCNKIDAVTGEDIQRVAKKMLATNPSVAAYGDLAFVPRYDFIQKAFK